MARSSRGDRGGKPVRLAELLPPALEQMGPRAVWTESRVRRIWGDVVGTDVAGHTWVRRLRGSTLEVKADPGGWATELRYLASVVCQKLNERLGSEVVKELTVTESRRREDQS